jgi:hypothetical protein
MRRSLITKVPALLVPLVLAFAVALGATIWLQNYCNRLLVDIQALASQQLNGTLSAERLSFTPLRNGIGITFSFYDVSLSDHRIATHRTPILTAKSIRTTLNFSRLLKGRILIRKLQIEEGKVQVFVGRDGYTNASIFEKKKLAPEESSDKKRDFLGRIEGISFRSCDVSYVDSLRGKIYAGTFRRVDSRLVRQDTSLHLEMRGAIGYDRLAFNTSRGAFLRGQLAHTVINLDYFPTSKRWRINPSSSIKVSDPRVSRIYISGLIDAAPRPGALSLDFRVDQTSLPATLKLLPAPLENTILRRNILPVLSAKVHVEGPLNSPIPWVTVRFETDTFQYALPHGKLRDIKVAGHFTNRADPERKPGDVNSLIDIPEVKGFFETIPLTGKLRVTNLSAPHSIMDFALHATPATVNPLLDTSRYLVRKGAADLQFHYEGSPITLYNSETDRLNGTLKGTLRLRDVSLSYLPGKITANQLQGDISFDENNVLLPSLRMQDGQNTLLISGKIAHLPISLFGSPRPAQAYVHVNIPEWKLSWPDKLINRDKRQTTRASTLKLSQLLDKTIDNLQITASLESEKMQYRRLKATQVRGRIIMKDRLIEVKNLSMNTCGGNVSFSGGFQTFKNRKYPLFFANGQLSQANVESVFYSLGNFGQNTLTHRHMKGTLSADFHFESLIKNDSAFYKPSMKGHINVDLTKARIVDFKPMLDIKRLLFRNRALENVQFAPLRTKFILKGEEVEVNKMKVESNVLYFFLDGVYSFGNKTDLSIQIPMSNLRRNDPNSNLTIRSVEDIRGSIIYLRALDEGGEVRIRYDKMKRFQ